MNINQIVDVEYIKSFFGETYKVTLENNFITYVPKDDLNSDYVVVKEYLNLIYERDNDS